MDNEKRTGLKEALKRAATNVNKGESESPENKEAPNIAGNLIKPVCQTISEKVITWVWPWGEIVVTGILAVQDDPNWDIQEGEYLVQLGMPNDEESPNCYTLADNTSKNLAELLLSAYNWQYIWRQFAGDYLLKSLQEAASNQPMVRDYVVTDARQDSHTPTRDLDA